MYFPLLIPSLLLGLLSSYTLAQTWTNLSSLPTTLQEHITLSPSPKRIVTIGGLVPVANSSLGATTSQVLIYDLPSNTWSSGTPIPTPLNHANAVTHKNKIYLMGGLSGLSQWPPSPDTFVYDFKRPSAGWKALAPIPDSHTPRGAAASAIWKDTIYLAGGIVGLWGPTVDVVSAYHVPSDSWVDLPEKARRLPGGGGRDHMAYAQIGSKFYVLGGRENGAENRKGDVFVLDLDDVGSGWVTKNGKMPTPRGGIATGLVANRWIYTFGGEGNNIPGREAERGVFGEVEVYDTKKDEWAKVEGGMRLARHGTSAVSIGNKIYVPGGAVVQGAGGVDLFDVFEP